MLSIEIGPKPARLGGAVIAIRIDQMLAKMGYRCLHRSDDAVNYQREDERVEFLHARRPIARRLLSTATERSTVFGSLCVVSAEGLIGLKLQALVNDPRRTQDREDIKTLLRANRATLNLQEVREYFSAENCFSMRSSKKSPDAASAIPVESHLVAEAGVTYSPRSDRDPFEIIDELMVVVEALCPRWPERDRRISGDSFRL
jgi:hypothetical protein